MGDLWLHGVLCMGEASIAAQGCSFPPRKGCREVIQAKRSPHASRVCTPTSRSTCLGFPEEGRASPGGKEDPSTNHVSGKGRPFPQGCLCSQQREGSKEKSREKQVLGPAAGELCWRQVQELNHVVKELHGPHDVLILQGEGGKQTGWAQNSSLGNAPLKPGFTLMATRTHGTRVPGITGSFQALLGCTALLICTGMPAWIRFPKQSPSLAPGSPAFTPSLPGGQWGNRGPQGTGRWPSSRAEC